MRYRLVSVIIKYACTNVTESWIRK